MSAIIVEVDAQVMTVTIDRPKANAIDAATSREMGSIFAQFRDNPELRVAILTGAGERFFSAGWDLSAAAAGEAADSDYGIGGFGGIARLPGLRKPIIAAVNGMAVGGGFELALACHLVVASEGARFWLPETKVGVVPDAACLHLPSRLSHARSMELLLTGRRLDAREAMAWGLVNQVVPQADLAGAARQMAGSIIEGAPLAVGAIMEIVEASDGQSRDHAYRQLDEQTLPLYRAMLRSQDAQEGPRAFAEKRPPSWQGS